MEMRMAFAATVKVNAAMVQTGMCESGEAARGGRGGVVKVGDIGMLPECLFVCPRDFIGRIPQGK